MEDKKFNLIFNIVTFYTILITIVAQKRKRCDNYSYPSYIDNQVIAREPTGHAGMPGVMGAQGFIGPTGATGSIGPTGPQGIL